MGLDVRARRRESRKKARNFLPRARERLPPCIERCPLGMWLNRICRLHDPIL
jgi:hypothetical protein